MNHPDHALVYGVPAKIHDGFVCQRGAVLYVDIECHDCGKIPERDI